VTEHRVDLSQLASVRDGSGHSIFGASGSPMFLNCVGALVPNLGVVDKGNVDSAYGSIAHGCTELQLKSGVAPHHLVGTTQSKDGFDIEIDEEMLDFVQLAVDRCEFEPGDHLVEEHVDYSCLTPIPNQGGTLDFAAMRYQEAVVHDHKFGKAEIVFAEWNFQLMLYAFGLYLRWDWLYDFQRFILRIAQPRIDHYDEWVCTREQLLKFAEWAKARMHEAWAIDAPRTAGEKQCKYCRVRNNCVANAKFQAELTEGVFGDVALPATAQDMVEFKERLDDQSFRLHALDAGTLTLSHIATLFKHRKTAEKFWHGLGAELFRRAQDGADLASVGYKLVEARAKRAFKDKGAAEAKLIALGVPFDEVIEESLVSPAQAEKLVRKAGHRQRDLPSLLGDLIYKPPGKTTLAALADRRPAIADLSALVFEDMTDNPETDEEGL
jgi:hypothetical protein